MDCSSWRYMAMDFEISVRELWEKKYIRIEMGYY